MISWLFYFCGLRWIFDSWRLYHYYGIKCKRIPHIYILRCINIDCLLDFPSGCAWPAASHSLSFSPPKGNDSLYLSFFHRFVWHEITKIQSEWLYMRCARARPSYVHNQDKENERRIDAHALARI